MARATKMVSVKVTSAMVRSALIAQALYDALVLKATLLASGLGLSRAAVRELDEASTYSHGSSEAMRASLAKLDGPKAPKTTLLVMEAHQARASCIALDLYADELKKVLKKQLSLAVDAPADTEAVLKMVRDLRAGLDDQLSLFPGLRVIHEEEPAEESTGSAKPEGVEE